MPKRINPHRHLSTCALDHSPINGQYNAMMFDNLRRLVLDICGDGYYPTECPDGWVEFFAPIMAEIRSTPNLSADRASEIYDSICVFRANRMKESGE